MILAMVEKKGLWQRVWRAVFGEPDVDGDDGEWLDEEEEEAVLSAKRVQPEARKKALEVVPTR
jgi:protoheme IX farnesyltransferase